MAIDINKRNRNAGKHPSYKGKTAAQIAAKKKYDSEYQKSPARVNYRESLNAANRKSQAAGKTKVGDKKDMSHTKKGNLVSESQKTNRGRNGQGGKSTKK